MDPVGEFRARGRNPCSTRRRDAPSVVSLVTWTRVAGNTLRWVLGSGASGAILRLAAQAACTAAPQWTVRTLRVHIEA